MSASSIFPPQALKGLIADDGFAAAYESVTPPLRARLKSQIAQLYAWYGRRTNAVEASEVKFKQGFAIREERRPVDWAVLVLGPAVSSPLQALAALLPPLCLGVEVLAVSMHDGEGLPAPILAALELAGQENVTLRKPSQLSSVVRSVLDMGRPGTFLVLGDEDAARKTAGLCSSAPNTRCWWPRQAGRLGVWAGKTDWDLEFLCWAYPDATIEIWGCSKDLSLPFERREGDFASFLAEGYQAVLVPDDLVGRSLAEVPLVLGPGQEGGFLWPDLTPALFLTERVALTRAGS